MGGGAGDQTGRPWERPRLPEAPTTPTLADFSLSGDPAPVLVYALRVAEGIHGTLVKASDGHPTFTGTALGPHRPGTNAHTHILLLPDATGAIATTLLWAPGGFDAEAQETP